MFSNWKNKRRFLLAVLLTGWLALLPAAAPAQAAADRWQRELTPAATRLLLEVRRLQQAGKEKEALARVEAFRQKASRSYVLVDFWAGNLYLAARRYREAVRVYRQLLRRQPAFQPALENLGLALVSLEKYGEAAEVLVRAVETAAGEGRPVNERLLADAGIACLLAGRCREAVRCLRRLVDGQPRPQKKYCQALVRAYLELHDYPAAGEVVRRQLAGSPNDAALWRLLMQVETAAGRYAEALAAGQVMASLAAPGDRDLELLAQLYQRVGVPGRAAALLARLCRRQQRPSAARLDRLVDLYLQAGNPEEALSWLEKKERLYPAPQNRLRRGEILYRAGRYREAYQVLSALENVPGKDGYQHLLAGYCAWYSDDLPAAREAFARAAASKRYRRQAAGLLRTVEEILRQRAAAAPTPGEKPAASG